MKSKLFVSVEGIEEPAWRTRAEDCLSAVLVKRNHGDGELSVLFCSDDKIRALNRDFRGKDSATDVLSFELGTVYEDEDGNSRYAAGDIAVSVDFLFKNAADFKVSPDEELKRLLIHGILHLEGMDHGDNHIGDAVYCDMISLQERLLADFASFSIIEEN